MSEARQILETAINNFSVIAFNRFFREKSRQFAAQEESYSRYNDDDFKNGSKLGEISFPDGDSLIICAFEVKKELSERAGKKAQYEKAKNILKSTENQKYSAGIFIFYDTNGNFRFSLVYPEAIGTRRQWNNFRRFTYLVSSDPKVINKTFKLRVGDGDFSSLSKIKDAFSVEKVTKEFYESIANWYFWAVEHCQFPKDAESEENGRNIAIIRLITRMIFIWFMRERGLVPKGLFEEKNIASILKSISSEGSTYYTGILQNLFFATLSTKKNERQFGSEARGHKGYNPDFGNQYVFRYQELFKNPDEIKKYFGDIPFLNGGLFECLDDKKNGIIIDGFSRTKKNQPTIPNFLFFSQEKNADLNTAYGTKNKTYKVRGLLDILSSFNFTIDENSPDDQDIALDPELLGRVFENLLASFNPETSTTARKATGSFYTPREIVDYIVAESLKAYFKIHLERIEKIEEKLENLFSAESQENPFDTEQSKKLVELIESVKIVDPAVGSGAFPMGALNKLVFILNKVDQGNKLWKQAQLKAADMIPDPNVRRDTKARIEEFFEGKNADYGRKLYLIQRCIYGVDIQQIAVEIAKLRFFISLLVNEKIDKTKDNWGIEPLPNLDFKIMQGNSLISEFLGVDFDNGQNKQERSGFMFGDEDDSLIKEFDRKKIDYQNESDKNKKTKLKNEVENLMIRIFEAKLQMKYSELKSIEEKAQSIPNLNTREEYIKKEREKFSKKRGFNLENIEKQLREFNSKKKIRQFFPWKLYFAEVFQEKDGFDVVIGNPPYLSNKGIKKEEKNYFIKYYTSIAGVMNLFVLFMERATNLGREKSSIGFIVPNNIVRSPYYRGIRKYLLERTIIKEIIDVGKGAFDGVTSETIIFLFSNSIDPENKIKISTEFFNQKDFSIKNMKHKYIEQKVFLTQEGYNFNIYVDEKSLRLKDKIIKNSEERLKNICEIKTCIATGDDKKYVTNKSLNSSYKKTLRGRDVDRYKITYSGLYVFYEHKILHRSRDERIFKQPEKILIRTVSSKILAAFDNNNYYPLSTCIAIIPKFETNLKFIIAILNSRLMHFYYDIVFNLQASLTTEISVENLEKLPIKKISLGQQKPFIDLVEKIITITKSTNYFENPNKQTEVKAYEEQIDQMVYKLYNLTPEEIKIVENSSK